MKFLIVLASLFLTCFSATAADDAFRYQVRTVTQDFNRPMGFDIAPDGFIYLIEVEGALTKIDPKSGQRTPIARIPVFSEQENGLLGIALDPDFAKNNFIYLLYSPKDFIGQRIARFTLKNDQLSAEKTVIEWGTQRRECCHHAGMLQFGPDHMLFATAGDNTHPFGDSQSYAPLDRRKDREPWNSEKSAGNPNDLRGGIIRIQIHPDGSYTIPKGNLFPPDTPGTRPEIYIMGCRNPWKMSVDAKTGYIYWGEVGPDAQNDGPRGPRGYDEINQARSAGNFGWPYFIANNQAYAMVDYATGKVGAKCDPAAPVNDSPLNTGAKNLPAAQPAFIYWPYAASPEWPILGAGGRTACAGPVFRYQPSFEKTDGFPEHYDNCLLFWDWQRNFIKWARMTPDQNLEKIENLTFNPSVKRPSDARFAKDGTLWMLDFGSSWNANKDAKLIHVIYKRGNVSPVAVMKMADKFGAIPMKITLDASGSSDPEKTPLIYCWSIGDQTLSTKAMDEITLTEAGDVVLELTVTDADGASHSVSHALVVGNTPPKLSLELAAGASGFYRPGQALAWQLKAEDAEQKEPLTSGAQPLVTLAAGQKESPGLDAIRASDCFNCHHATQKLVGPPFKDIAKAYKGKEGAVEISALRIIKGSSEVWGTTPMMPHPQFTPQQAEAMVRWIFSLDDAPTPQVVRAAQGRFTMPADASSVMELSATFMDAGNGKASPLASSTSVRLYPETISAKDADAIVDCQILPHTAPRGGQFVGDIKNGSQIKFNQILLTGEKSVTFSYASAQIGANVTLKDQHDKTLATLRLEPTGGWDTWKTATVALTNVNDQAIDLRIILTDPGKRSGIMNIDTISFGK